METSKWFSSSLEPYDIEIISIAVVIFPTIWIDSMVNRILLERWIFGWSMCESENSMAWQMMHNNNNNNNLLFIYWANVGLYCLPCCFCFVDELFRHFKISNGIGIFHIPYIMQSVSLISRTIANLPPPPRFFRQHDKMKNVHYYVFHVCESFVSDHPFFKRYFILINHKCYVSLFKHKLVEYIEQTAVFIVEIK